MSVHQLLKTFSFRAECNLDVDRFCRMVRRRFPRIFNVQITALKFNDGRFSGEMAVEVDTTETLESLMDAMRDVIDGHVMLQTLRELPLSENNLARNYDVH